MQPHTLPADIAAERATLGAILLEREAIIAVAGDLTPDDFYLEKHALVYQAARACYERREPPDLATVAAELRRQEQLHLVGGIAFLGELVAEVPTAVHIAYYAKGVIHAAGLRRLIEASGQIAALGYDEAPGLEATYDLAEQTLFAVTQRRGEQGWMHISQVANEWFEQLANQDTTEARRGTPTGLADLDRLLGGGLQRGDLILLAARPGVGKTALALAITGHAANQGLAVGVVSQEMSRDQLLQRLVSARTGIDLARLRSDALREDERLIALDALGALSELPIYVDDQAGKTSGAIRASARRLTAAHGCDLLVIDYLQLLVGEQRENRVQEVAAISRDLKLLARELDCPILALSQLSRAVEQRANKVPQLSDLRDSGALEQDADVVMFIYREELYDTDSAQHGVAEVHIAKHRNGPLGVVPLRFEAHTTSFQTLERYQEVEGF